MKSKSILKEWIVIYTKPRCEKVVKQNLIEKGFEVYLPLIKERRRWSDRKKWVEFPLFRSYLFVKTKVNEALYVLETPNVVKAVRFGTKIAIVKEELIKALKQMLDGGYTPVPVNYFLKGDKVKVNQGPLKDIKGEVIQINNDEHLLIRVDAINQALAVLINRGILEPR